MKKLFFLTLLLLFGMDGFAFASGSHPGKQYHVLSEYIGSAGAAPNQERWVVSTKVGPAGSLMVEFFSTDRHLESKPICVLTLNDDGKNIDWLGNRSSQKKTSHSGLLLLHGFPVPADVLPLDIAVNEEARVFQERLSRGGRIFVKKYLVETHEMSTAAAKIKGLLKVDMPADSMLRLITAREEGSGKLAAQQLWPSDGGWWLYEETEFRRSWMILE